MKMSFEEYRSRPEFGSTTMKRMVDSPEDFKYGVMVCGSEALRKGTNLHSATLERELFDRMIVFPDLTFRSVGQKRESIEWAEAQFNTPCLIGATSSADDLRAEFVLMASRDGQALVYPAERDLALDMAASVDRNAEAVELLDGAICEQSYFHGQLKTRPDATNSGPLIDLKQDKEPSQRRFEVSAWEKKYGFLLAHSEAVLAANGIAVDSWHWIVVKPKHHLVISGRNIHQVEVYQAGPDIIATARQQHADAVGLLLECQASDEWPGPVVPQSPTILSNPAWVNTQPEDADIDMSGVDYE